MELAIVGRDAELACLDAFLRRGEPGVDGLVLAGEAGIGKSILWEAGVEQARSLGYTVLSSRPVEAERTLDGVVLADLLERIVDDVLPTLLAPRRRALEVALLREEASADPVDRRALAVAVRDLLQEAGHGQQLLLAIDDAQWVDPLSSSTLAFALRRLPAGDLLVLLAHRATDGAATQLEQGFAPDQVRRLSVGPLSLGALHLFLPVTRPVRRQHPAHGRPLSP